MPYYPLNPAVGQVVQFAHTTSSAVATGTTTIPQDDTIPQNTEGNEYLTLAITPRSTTNILVIEFNGVFATSAVQNFTVALFQDTTANALAARGYTTDSVNGAYDISLVHTMTAGTTSSTTLKIRAGGAAAGTTTFNGKAGTRLYSTTQKSIMTITEIQA